MNVAALVITIVIVLLIVGIILIAVFVRTSDTASNKAAVASVSTKPIVCQYYLQEFKPSKYWGLGDFLRGCCKVYQLCAQHDQVYEIHLEHHPIGEFLISTCSAVHPLPAVELFDLDGQEKLAQKVKQNQAIMHVMTNAYADAPLTAQCKAFVKSSLSPNQEMQVYLLENVKLQNYRVLHIRAGDRVLGVDKQLNPDHLEEVVEALQELGGNWSNTYVISDNLKLTEYLAQTYGMNKIETNGVCHLGKQSCSKETVKDTLFDFFLMAQSAEILQVSVYQWGSGFSEWASRLFDIPLRKTLLRSARSSI